jgi:hypothetical protein
MKVVFEVDDYWVNGTINIDYQYLAESNQIEFTFICKFYYPEEFHQVESNKKRSVFYINVDAEFYYYLSEKFPFLNIYAPYSEYGYDNENDEVIMKYHAECEIKNES